MRPSKHFERICRSAFDFLMRSTSELESDPKYALIHFAHGLELILKARLYREHWSLVITTQPSLKALATGDFHSVSCRDAMTRLEMIVGEPVPADARKAFDTIISHRNRVVHFYHDSLEASANESLRSSIATDICLGWYHLRERLNFWRKHFTAFEGDIVQLEVKMKSVRQFLQVIFKAQESYINAQIANGIEVTSCPSCGFVSALISPITDALFNQHCAVCNLKAPLIRFACADSDCGLTLTASGWDGFQPIQCVCGYTNDQEDLSMALDTSYRRDETETIGCAFCSNPSTVVEHKEVYVCVECFSYSADLEHCQYCGQGQIGSDLSESMMYGCEFCEGAVENSEDD